MSQVSERPKEKTRVVREEVVLKLLLEKEEEYKTLETRYRELRKSVGEIEANANIFQQKLYYLRNVYNDYGNIIKGLFKQAPNSLKAAQMLDDFVYTQVGNIFAAHALYHPRRQWSLLNVFLLFAGIMFFGAVLFTPFGAELGRALSIPANQYALLVALSLVTVIIIVTSRRPKA